MNMEAFYFTLGLVFQALPSVIAFVAAMTFTFISSARTTAQSSRRE